MYLLQGWAYINSEVEKGKVSGYVALRKDSTSNFQNLQV